jgi:hypothetical protein
VSGTRGARGACDGVPLDTPPEDGQVDNAQVDDDARLAAVFAALAALRADRAAGAGSSPAGRTGGEALARWRASRLALLRIRPPRS